MFWNSRYSFFPPITACLFGIWHCSRNWGWIHQPTKEIHSLEELILKDYTWEFLLPTNHNVHRPIKSTPNPVDLTLHSSKMESYHGQCYIFLTFWRWLIKYSDNTGLKYNVVIKETPGLPCEAQKNLSCHKVGWMLSRVCQQAKWGGHSRGRYTVKKYKGGKTTLFSKTLVTHTPDLQALAPSSTCYQGRPGARGPSLPSSASLRPPIVSQALTSKHRSSNR